MSTGECVLPWFAGGGARATNDHPSMLFAMGLVLGEKASNMSGGVEVLYRFLLLPSIARADIITSTLGTGNSDISGYTGPYGTVTIDLTSPTTADITFVSDNVGTNNFYFIDGGSAAVEVNATSWTVSGLSGVAAPFGSGVSLSDSGIGNVDGFR